MIVKRKMASKQIIMPIVVLCVSILIAMTLIMVERNSDINFEISVDENIYLEREPIVIIKRLTNISDGKMIVAEPDEIFTQYNLRWLEGDVKEIPELMIDRMAYPENYGEKIEPEDTSIRAFNLLEIYSYGLPIGTYSLSARYFVPRRYHRCWQGEIWSNEVSFSVVSPQGKEQEVFRLYKQAGDILNRHSREEYRLARKLLDELLEEYPDSIYAKYALYLKAISYWRVQKDGKQDFGNAINEFAKFVTKYPGIPYFSESAAAFVGRGYLNLGELGKAKAVFLKLPDSYFKQKMLEKIQHL